MPPDPGGGFVPPPLSHPDSRTVTSAWAGGSVSGGSRTFQQIIQEEKQTRNILEINILKNQVQDENGEPSRPKSLTFEVLGEFIFDILVINPDDCVAINLNSGRYDVREVKLKPDIDASIYLRPSPVIFRNHSITVNRQRQNITRVTF